MEKKFPEADPDFYLKVRGACRNDYERGLVYILQWTGMHLSCLLGLTPSQMDDGGHIYWRRARTHRQMRALIPNGDRSTVRAWIEVYGSNRRTDRAVRYTVQAIGDRAGFPGLSPQTFRTMRGCTLLDDGMPPHQVCHILGCKLDTLMDHYAVLQADRRLE